MKAENVEKLIANFHDKTEYVRHIRNLKQALNHELALTKVHGIIEFNQKSRLKLYIDMNLELTEKIFEKHIFKLTNTAAFRKTIENMRKDRESNLKQAKKKGII